MPLIPLSPEVRRAIGTKLRAWIDLGLDAKNDCAWWKDVTGFYENRKPADAGKGKISMHMPLSQPRQDALTSNVCTVVGKQDPVMLCDLPDTELAGRRQKFIHKVWDYAGFDIQIRKASTDATNFNRCFYKVTPNGFPEMSGGQQSPNTSLKPGIEIGVIPPKDMTVFPAVLGGCQQAVLVGNRLYKRVQTINDRIKAKEYYEVKVSGGDNPEEHDDTGSIQHAGMSMGLMAQEPNQQAAECFDLIVRLDLTAEDLNGGKKGKGPEGEKRYRAVLAYKNSDLLLLEEYPETFQYTWYFEGFYITSDLYWPGTSVGRNLLPLQDGYNKLWSQFITAGWKMADPKIIGPALNDGQKWAEAPSGAYLETDETVQPWSPDIHVELQPITMAMEKIERTADQVARVSQNSLGVANSSADTATENGIIASGVAVGIEEYIANFSSCFPAMAEHTEHIMASMPQEMATYYTHAVDVPVVDPMTQQPAVDPQSGQPALQPQEMPILTPEELKKPTCWRVNGTSPSSTPQAKLQAGQMLVQVAADPEYRMNKPALGALIVANSSLSGDGNLQYSEQEWAQMQAQAQMQQQQQLQAQMMMQQQQGQQQMQMQDQKAGHELTRESVRARLNGDSEAARALVERFGEKAIRRLLDATEDQGDQKAKK